MSGLAQLTRHQIGATLLGAFRAEGLGVRDLFEGRQEPLTWFFRCLVYDQSELDILESGALEMLHAPSALIELSIDEVALAGAVIGAEGIAGYLSDDAFEDVDPAEGQEGVPGESGPDLPPVAFHPDITLGTLTLDVAPPTLWLEERPADPEANESLARRLGFLAQDVGRAADAVEVHIEGALDASEEGWADQAARVRPAGVSVHFTFDIPLLDVDERKLARTFETGAATTARALEAIRRVFERAG